MNEPIPGRFVSEPITPVGASFLTDDMTTGAPGLPMCFRWRKSECQVTEVLDRWKTTGPCHSGSNEKYVRRHWFRIRTDDGSEMEIYFDRQPRAKQHKKRWWLATIRQKNSPESSAMENAPPDPMQPIDLIEHPEGGRFREVFRSARMITTPNGDSRSALTHIYFSLDPGEVSRFHRVSSDEVWNLYQGDGLTLHLWDGTANPPVSITLAADANCFCAVVSAGCWQAAEPLSGTVLVGCSVAPGFEFTDFELMEPDSAPAQLLCSLTPALSKFIHGIRTNNKASANRRPALFPLSS